MRVDETILKPDRHNGATCWAREGTSSYRCSFMAARDTWMKKMAYSDLAAHMRWDVSAATGNFPEQCNAQLGSEESSRETYRRTFRRAENGMLATT